MATLPFAVGRGLAFAATLALAGALLVVPGAEAKPDPCRVVNEAAPATSYATLQAAVAAADAGDTLRVKGTCVGITSIDKSMTIIGRPGATLDGDGDGPVLDVECGYLCPVTLANLTITDGKAGSGGGINSFGGDLTFVDSIVTGNEAQWGGGIYSSHGKLTLHDTYVDHNAATTGAGIYSGTGRLILDGLSSVHHNTASGDGGGVYNEFGGDLILTGTSSISWNTASGDGGGVYNPVTTATELRDASSIHHNTASGDGGGIWSSSILAVLTNCVAGVNVHHNIPGDIFIEP